MLDSDFKKSAQLLDNRRLDKQRSEAYQIYTTLKQFRLLSKYFNIPDYPSNIVTPKEDRIKWFKKILNKFEKMSISCILIRQNMVICINNDQTIPKKIGKGNILIKDGEDGKFKEIKQKTKKVISEGYWWDYVLPGEELITPGFKLHPAILMWIGFEETLKYYINCHIDEWISRGFNNNMQLYGIKHPIIYPDWIYDDKLIKCHKATLINREIDRLEKCWYLKKPDFISSWINNDHNLQYLQKIINNLSNDNWFDVYEKSHILCLGNFNKLIWP